MGLPTTHEYISYDESIDSETFNSLEYEAKVKHRMRVALAIRSGVAGFAVLPSDVELTKFREKECLGPDNKPYEVHPYDMLRQTVVDCLAAEGIYAPVELQQAA